MRTTQQVLDINTDLNTIAEGLREMGLSVQATGTEVSYSGTYEGKYYAGSIKSGVITERSEGSNLDQGLLKKHIAVANTKAQIEKRNKGKSPQHKWVLKKLTTGPFDYQLIK